MRDWMCRERDEAEKSQAAEAQAQMERANMQRHYDSIMAQIKLDWEIHRERDLRLERLNSNA